MNKENPISQQIAERIKQRLGEKITLDEPFSDDFAPDKKTDTILNFIIDRTLRDAIYNPSIEKLIKINDLAEGKECKPKEK